MSFPHKWRALVTGAVTGLVVAAAIIGQSALASGGGAATPAPSDEPFLAAVAQMVQAGTINDAQAHLLDADIHIGHIDTDELVANGTMTQAQAQAVMDRLGAVKRSMAPPAQQGRVVRPANRKRPQG